MTVAIMKIGDQSVYIETSDSEHQTAFAGHNPSDGLPPGAEPVTAAEDLQRSAKLMRSAIVSMSEILIDSIQAIKPDEVTFEFALGFKGEAQPIPIIVKASSEANLKVTLKWKSSDKTR
jgi:hypothetical protein